MKYKPVQNYLLIRPTPAEEKTESGLYIPEMARPTINDGTIVKCGPSAEQFSPGQVVIWQQHAESKLKIDDEYFILVSANDILLIEEEEPPVESCKVATETGQIFPPVPIGNS